MSSRSEHATEIEGRLKQSLKSPYPENGTVWSALIETLADEIQEIEESRGKSEQAKFVTDAEKNGLDRIAELFQVERKSDETNSEFRVRLQVVLRSQLTSATLDEVLEVVSVFLDTNRDQIEMRENRGGEDAQFTVSIPANTVGQMGLRTDSINNILGDISAAGVHGTSTLKTGVVTVPLDMRPVIPRPMTELDPHIINMGYNDVVRMQTVHVDPATIGLLPWDVIDDKIFENALSSSSLNGLSGDNWLPGMYGDTGMSPYSLPVTPNPVIHRTKGATTAGALLNISLVAREMSRLSETGATVLVETLSRLMTDVSGYTYSLLTQESEIEMTNDIGFSSEDTNNLSIGGWKAVDVGYHMVNGYSTSPTALDVENKSIGGTTVPLAVSVSTLAREMTDVLGEVVTMSSGPTGALTLNKNGFGSRNLNVLSAGNWS